MQSGSYKTNSEPVATHMHTQQRVSVRGGEEKRGIQNSGVVSYDSTTQQKHKSDRMKQNEHERQRERQRQRDGERRTTQNWNEKNYYRTEQSEEEDRELLGVSLSQKKQNGGKNQIKVQKAKGVQTEKAEQHTDTEEKRERERGNKRKKE